MQGFASTRYACFNRIVIEQFLTLLYLVFSISLDFLSQLVSCDIHVMRMSNIDSF